MVSDVKGFAVVMTVHNKNSCLVEWFDRPNIQKYVPFHKFFLYKVTWK